MLHILKKQSREKVMLRTSMESKEKAKGKEREKQQEMEEDKTKHA